MNIKSKLIVTAALIVALFGAFLVAPKVSAFETREDKNLAANETVTGDLFISGENVVVAGTVNGNLFVGGNTVTVSGNVSGNVFAAGSTVTVSGNVGRTLFVGAGAVDVTGSVGRDIFAGAGQLMIDGKVKENVFAGAGSLLLKKDVAENLYVGAGQVTVTGTIGKDAFISTGSDTIDRSKIKGILSLDIQEGDKTSFKERMNEQRMKKATAGAIVGAIILKLLVIAGTVLFGLFLYNYFPLFASAIETEVETKTMRNIGVGTLVLFAAPLLVIALLVSVIGIPFALFAGWALTGALAVAKIFVGKIFGSKIITYFKKSAGLWVELTVGLLVLTALAMIPFINFFVGFAINTVVVGAIVSAKQYRVGK
jgi:hypothetical protein